MGGFKDYLNKTLNEGDESQESHQEPQVVDYDEVEPNIKNICEYLITEIKQLGVAAHECSENGSNCVFNEEWFKEEYKEIKDKIEELKEFIVPSQS
jgi:hypothetical protein